MKSNNHIILLPDICNVYNICSMRCHGFFDLFSLIVGKPNPKYIKANLNILNSFVQKHNSIYLLVNAKFMFFLFPPFSLKSSI